MSRELARSAINITSIDCRLQRLGCNGITPHSAFRTLHSNGFTLIEIVITIAIVGIIAGIAAMIIAQGVRAYSDERLRSDVHYQARFAMERMSREIRTIRSRADVTTMLNTDLQFADVSGNAVRFNLVGSDIRRSGSLLASNITSFAFSYYQDSGAAAPSAATLWTIEISLTATQGAEVLQMRTRVHPRNF